MYKTIQPLPARLTKTAYPSFRHPSNNISLIRPNTVDISSFHSSGKSFRTIDVAQLQLGNSFRKQMSPYIKQKIKHLTHRNKKKLYFTRPGSSNQDPQQMFNQTIKTIMTSPIKIKTMKICTILSRDCKSPIKMQNVVDQAIITNTKQRINRLISLKQEQQDKYEHLRINLRNKCKQDHKHLKRRSLIDYEKLSPLPQMETEKWDLQWKQDVTKQSSRYRNRLIAKHKRSFEIPIYYDTIDIN